MVVVLGGAGRGREGGEEGRKEGAEGNTCLHACHITYLPCFDVILSRSFG